MEGWKSRKDEEQRKFMGKTFYDVEEMEDALARSGYAGDEWTWEWLERDGGPGRILPRETLEYIKLEGKVMDDGKVNGPRSKSWWASEWIGQFRDDKKVMLRPTDLARWVKKGPERRLFLKWMAGATPLHRSSSQYNRFDRAESGLRLRVMMQVDEDRAEELLDYIPDWSMRDLDEVIRLTYEGLQGADDSGVGQMVGRGHV